MQEVVWLTAPCALFTKCNHGRLCYIIIKEGIIKMTYSYTCNLGIERQQQTTKPYIKGLV